MGTSSMNQLVSISSSTLPALVTAAGERASMHFLEFFAANIRNPHSPGLLLNQNGRVVTALFVTAGAVPAPLGDNLISVGSRR
jgi:hypothetical protein